MKKWIAIWMAVCLMAGVGALAQDVPEATEPASAGLELPAPEEVAVLGEVDVVEEEPGDAEAPEAEEVAEVEAEEPTEIVEVEVEEPTEAFEVWFEEGFSLTLPEGWVSYAVSDEDGAEGVRYALGDGTGERILYIQFTPTQMDDIEALSEAVENTDGLSKTGELSFGGRDFVAFIDARQNASCCATLWNDDVMLFIFTPQTDSDYMLTASELMESFKEL